MFRKRMRHDMWCLQYNREDHMISVLRFARSCLSFFCFHGEHICKAEPVTGTPKLPCLAVKRASAMAEILNFVLNLSFAVSVRFAACLYAVQMC